jgi:hypothetical protein
MWWMAHRMLQSPAANCGEIFIILVSYGIGECRSKLGHKNSKEIV